MKKLIFLLLLLFLLSGCGAEDLPETLPPAEGPAATETPAATEPPLPWTESAGMPWDEDGVLLEMPLSVPDALHYSSFMPYDGDLLLWSIDSHLEGVSTIEMCLVELDDGSVIAQRDVDMAGYVMPQPLGDSLYLCDNTGGQVLELNKELKTTAQWDPDSQEGSWYMGGGYQLYQLDAEYRLAVLNLETGEKQPVMEGDPILSWMQPFDGYATISYYDVNTGARNMAILDLATGAVQVPGFTGDLVSLNYANGTMLGCKYTDSNIYYLQSGDGPVMLIPKTENQINLLPEGYLLETSADNNHVWLYDLNGNPVSSAQVQSDYNGYNDVHMIWNESQGGYFFILRSYTDAARLLFWDISKGTDAMYLPLTEIPQPDEAMVQLRERADRIGEEYGVHILLGEECDTEFIDFTASHVTDWERLQIALDTLERALSAYPEGFIRQLKYDTYYSIQIQLISDLWANGPDRQGDGYVAFTQSLWDHHLMVVDIDDCVVDTYFHEFSHIIDNYLEWDALQRSDALYSEAGWAQWNPDWFTGYSYDYSIEHELWDAEHFIDGYATISPTEDRARVMEYAMAGYDWAFAASDGLINKLDYYCRCIRDAFDTTGWGDTVIWEQCLG